MACNKAQLDGAMMNVLGAASKGYDAEPSAVAILNECVDQPGVQEALTTIASTPQFTPTPGQSGMATPTVTPTQTQAAVATPTMTPTPSTMPGPQSSSTPTAYPTSAGPEPNPTPIPNPFSGQPPVGQYNIPQFGQPGPVDIQQPTPPADPSAGALQYGMNLPPGLAGGEGAMTDPAAHGYQSPELNVQTLGMEPWMQDAGITNDYILTHGWNDPLVSDMFAKQQGLPAYWGRENEELLNTIPGLYALNNPGQPTPTGAEYAGMMDEYAGMVNTPGQYMDTSSTWDNLFAPQMEGGDVNMGGGYNFEDLAQLTPDEQESVIIGSAQTLFPYLTKDASQALQFKLQRATMDWKEKRLANDPSAPATLLEYLYSIGADNWV